MGAVPAGYLDVVLFPEHKVSLAIFHSSHQNLSASPGSLIRTTVYAIDGKCSRRALSLNHL